MSGTALNPTLFADVLDIVRPLDQLQQVDVGDDLDGEGETIPNLEEGDSNAVAEMLKTVNSVSKGVSEGTHDEYRRLIAQCKEFLIRKKLVPPEQFFCERPHRHAPEYIVMWIMDECDELNLDGIRRPSTEVRATYGTAQKMHASMTYAFGRIHGLGSMHWQRSVVDEGMVGNPSVSEMVSRYMLSLHRRKAQAGETTTSARAITSETLKKLYNFNQTSDSWDLKGHTAGSKKSSSDQWGGGRARRLLQLAYTIAFTCLLRVDEVLKIQSKDITLLNEDKLMLTLRFRKTSQCGDIKPFVVCRLPREMAHLCPVRAYSEWLDASNISGGYIFRRLGSGDRVSGINHPMTAEYFLELFRNNLIDIGVDPIAYGTHSFRRGGCQWMAVDIRWPLRRICEWGGWSLEYSHLTIVKYLISWNDDPSQSREDFLDFNRAPVQKCFACGRSCGCS
ncbi:hypothetical protein V8E53_004598 [Lactarius tabidus]